MRFLLAFLRVVVLPAATALPGFSQTAVRPSFEVASVRLDRSRGTVVAARSGGPGTTDPGRITLTKVPFNLLIWQAYDIEPVRIEGPDWIRDLYEHAYTITAIMPPATTKEQLRLMFQNLLAERFGLKVHREVRSLPGFELTSIPGGPRLSEWTPEPIPDGPVARWSEDSEGYPILSPGHTGCTYGGFVGVGVPVKVTCRRSMPDFAQDLGRFIRMANGALSGEPTPEVIDKTGLSAIYEFKFMFEGTTDWHSSVARTSDPSGAPALSNALLKQLGLKLVKAGNVPVTILVVDHAAEAPTEN